MKHQHPILIASVYYVILCVNQVDMNNTFYIGCGKHVSGQIILQLRLWEHFILYQRQEEAVKGEEKDGEGIILEKVLP